MSTSGSIKFGKMTFPRNGVLASGILGVTGASMVKAAKSGAGGVTSKSISLEEREGHPTPVIQMYKAGMINAVGLSSTGVENSNKESKNAFLRDDSFMSCKPHSNSLYYPDDQCPFNQMK